MKTTRAKKTHAILMSRNQIYVPGITCVVKVSLYKIALIIYRIIPEKVRCEFVDFFGKVVLLPFTRNVIRPISQPVRKTFSQTPASYQAVLPLRSSVRPGTLYRWPVPPRFLFPANIRCGSLVPHIGSAPPEYRDRKNIHPPPPSRADLPDTYKTVSASPAFPSHVPLP